MSCPLKLAELLRLCRLVTDCPLHEAGCPCSSDVRSTSPLRRPSVFRSRLKTFLFMCPFPRLVFYLPVWAHKSIFNLLTPQCTIVHQGRGDRGIYGYIYPKKSVQVNFLWGRNDVRTAIEHEYIFKFYPPRKKTSYTPKTNFWLRPCSALQSEVSDLAIACRPSFRLSVCDIGGL